MIDLLYLIYFIEWTVDFSFDWLSRITFPTLDLGFCIVSKASSVMIVWMSLDVV